MDVYTLNDVSFISLSNKDKHSSDENPVAAVEQASLCFSFSRYTVYRCEQILNCI